RSPRIGWSPTRTPATRTCWPRRSCTAYGWTSAVAVAAPKPGWRGRLELLARPRRPETLPATLDRRPVYILPTAFGWFFGALLLALLLAGTANTSLFSAHLQLSGLQVVALDAEPVAAGKPLLLGVHVRARPGRTRRGLRVEGMGSSARLSLDDDAGSTTLGI